MNLKNKKTLLHLGLCLLAALAVSLLNARGMMNAKIIPFGDSGSFYNYALELYGHIHSGQWNEAIGTLTTPAKNLFPSSIFFLFLPSSLATSAGYGFINNLSWHLLTLAGLWIFLSTLKQNRFTLPIFLLISANVYAFDPAYYYYMDFPFMAVAFLGLAMTLRALKSQSTKSILLAGVFSAVPFLSKPPNAFINTALILFFIAGVLITQLILSRQKSEWTALFRFAAFWTVGFLPVFLLAAFFGGLEAIIDVIYINEVGNIFYSELSEGGLKRLLYFPLCMSFYYSQIALGSLLAFLAAFRFIPPLKKFSTTPEAQPADRSDRILFSWLVLIFILFWGLYFSFRLENKLIRSLAPMLPILWILLFSATPLKTLRLRVLIPASLLFFCLPFLQAEKGFIQDKQNRNPETYQLDGDWLNRWPSKRPDLAMGTATTDHLKQALIQAGVTGGKIGVGSEMINWNAHALNNWCNQDSLRAGNPPAYDFKYICPGRFTKPLQATMDGADALLLILEPRVQYSQILYKINADLANYAMKNWQNKEARVHVLYNGMKQPSVCIVAFNSPLQGEPLARLKKDLYENQFSEKGESSAKFRSLKLRDKIGFLLHGANQESE